MILGAIMKEHPLPRWARFLVLDWAFVLPFISAFMRRVGGVPASPHNAARLLEQDELVMVFPEGVKGTGKPFSERYRLQRFGRGGFVEVALRTGAPIVPVAVVGSEEIYPKLGDAKPLARAIGAPFVPITPTFPWLGPLGLVPLPVEVADRVLRADRPLRATARTPPRTAGCCSTCPSRCGRRSRRSCTRTSSSAARRSSRTPAGWTSLVTAGAGGTDSSAHGDGRRRARASAAARGRVPEAARRRRCRRSTPTIRPGPLLRATGLRMRFEFPDLPLVLNVAATEEPGSPPALEVLGRGGLGAEAEPADGLEGRQRLPPGQGEPGDRDRPGPGAAPRGDTRCALLYVPPLRLVVPAYRRLVAQEHPHLLLEQPESDDAGNAVPACRRRIAGARVPDRIAVRARPNA